MLWADIAKKTPAPGALEKAAIASKKSRMARFLTKNNKRQTRVGQVRQLRCVYMYVK